MVLGQDRIAGFGQQSSHERTTQGRSHEAFGRGPFDRITLPARASGQLSLALGSTRCRPGFGTGSVWWRWRESNPRPKMPPFGVYKPRLAFWFRNGPSHERDRPTVAFEGLSVAEEGARLRYARFSRRLVGARERPHQTAFPMLEEPLQTDGRLGRSAHR